jgi:hypothetical protein
VFPVVAAALRRVTGGGFRLCEFSVQADHIHLLVEADGAPGWRRGIQGLAIRLAKAVNRALGRRGAVWHGRYHARRLATPREIRNAFVYVLANWRKHERRPCGLDPCSSAAWFTGWRDRAANSPSPLAAPRTWLARVGWRRHGLIGFQEGPRGAPP